MQKQNPTDLTPLTVIVLLDDQQRHQLLREVLRALFPDGDLDTVIDLLTKQRDAIRRADQRQAALDAAADAEDDVTIGAKPTPQPIREEDDAQWSAPEPSSDEPVRGTFASVGAIKQRDEEIARLKRDRDKALQERDDAKKQANLAVARAQKLGELAEELIAGRLDQHFDLEYVASH